MLDTKTWVESYLSKTPEGLNPAVPTEHLRLGFLPGTGLQSNALARAYAKAGYTTWIGSRSSNRAEQACQRILAEAPHAKVRGGSLREVAAAADVIFLILPITSQKQLQEAHQLLQSMAKELENKIVIDVTNVYWFITEDQWGSTSSTLLHKAALTFPVKWACAWKHVFFKLIEGDPAPDENNPHSVFVCADDAGTASTVMHMVNAIKGFKALYAGDLRYSKIIELLSPLWLPQLEQDNGGLAFKAGWRFGY